MFGAGELLAYSSVTATDMVKDEEDKIGTSRNPIQETLTLDGAEFG